jgi:hypothetical protein
MVALTVVQMVGWLVNYLVDWSVDRMAVNLAGLKVEWKVV